MCTHLSLRGGDWGTPCSANQTTLPQPAPLCRCCRLIPLPLSELTDVISPIPGLDCTACQVTMCRVRRTSRRQELTQRPPSSQERKHTKKWVPVATNPPHRSTGDSGGGGEGGGQIPSVKGRDSKHRSTDAQCTLKAGEERASNWVKTVTTGDLQEAQGVRRVLGPSLSAANAPSA